MSRTETGFDEALSQLQRRTSDLRVQEDNQVNTISMRQRALKAWHIDTDLDEDQIRLLKPRKLNDGKVEHLEKVQKE
jgi:hypothetical protein